MTRVNQEIAETGLALTKALSYSQEMQKPAQIEFYRAHLDYLLALRDGRAADMPEADIDQWDVCRIHRT